MIWFLATPTPFSDSPTGKEGLLQSDHCPNNDAIKRRKIKGFLNALYIKNSNYLNEKKQ
tara:strand:- start:1275 stop:1451 length:177 start_codon:yes stop_codon:yes gene_type:complete